jgi:uncharacterized protein (TIGR02145 family)
MSRHLEESSLKIKGDLPTFAKASTYAKATVDKSAGVEITRGKLLHATSNYWSSTTNSNNTQNAWNMNQNNGNTNNNTKTNTNSVRCVR